MLTRLRILRLVAVLGLTSASILISACDGSVAPSEQVQSSSSSSPTSLASECGIPSFAEELSTIKLTPRQIVNSLDYAFRSVWQKGLIQGGRDAMQQFNHETIAALIFAELDGNPQGPRVRRQGFHDVAAAYINFRGGAESGFCDLTTEACASEFLSILSHSLGLHPVTDVQLKELTTQFASAPVDTLAEMITDKLTVIDLTELNQSEIAAIRLSLLLQHRMPGYNYQHWAQSYSLDSPVARKALAESLLLISAGFKTSVEEFFAHYMSGLYIVGEAVFPEETLDTLYLQVLGGSSPAFKGTLADIFNSKMALVSDQFVSAYRDEEAIDFGRYSAVGARLAQPYTLFEVEGRPGVFSQLAALKYFPLTGYHYERAFTCGNVPLIDHVQVYDEDYSYILDELIAEESAQGFKYPNTYYVTRLVELGEQRIKKLSCEACHLPSLSVERALLVFDENGISRSEYNLGDGLTLPIETNGQFYEFNGGLGSELIAFDDLTDFFSQVVETKMAKQCFVEKWVERSLQVSDEFNCESPTLQQAFDASGGHIRTLILDIIASDLFTSNGQTN